VVVVVVVLPGLVVLLLLMVMLRRGMNAQVWISKPEVRRHGWQAQVPAR
jgi:hypothetical protein